MYNYSDIRKKFYKDILRKFNDKLLGKYYSKFKSLLYLEIGIIIVFFLLKLKIKPNSVTLFFSIIVIFASIMLGSKINELIFFSIVIFYFVKSLDFVDGFMARLTRQSSSLGHALDTWGGLVIYNFFQIGIGLYVFSKSNEIIFIYFLLTILSLNLIDFKKHYLAEFSYKKKNKINYYRKQFKLENKKNYLKKLFAILDYDGRSRYNDIILFFIILEINFTELFITKYIFTIWFFTSILKFIFKFVKTYNLIKN